MATTPDPPDPDPEKRLEELEEDIEALRRREKGLEPHVEGQPYYESGDHPEDDDQAITPPG